MGRIRGKAKADNPTRVIRLDRVATQMLDIGVGREALHTTLEKEGRTDLRTVILDELYLDKNGEVLPVLFYPAQSRSTKQFLSNVFHCDLVYSLFLKECWLNQMQVGQFSIADMYSVIVPEYNIIPEEDTERFERFEPLVFIPDFYMKEHEGNRYSNPGAEEAVEHYIKRRIWSDNVGVVIKSLLHPERITHSWSPSLLAYLDRKALIYDIHGPEVK